MTTHEAATVREAIALAGVSKSFGTGDAAVTALEDIDLTIGAGELVVILGPSGSGKTTLCNVIGGIESADTGTVVVEGESIGQRQPADLASFRRHNVGFIFQFFNLIPTLTARENVQIIMEMTGRGEAADVDRLLSEVGLSDRADNFPSQLSGGQQQRVAVARALATQPRILLADEPTGALDLPTGRQILGLLQGLASAGRTVLVITHNASVAQIGDRVVTIVDGRVESNVTNDHPARAEDVTW